MPVAKATAITQVTDPSCELHRVIGLSVERGAQVEHFDWPCARQKQEPQRTDSGESIDLIGWHGHTHARTHVCAHMYLQKGWQDGGAGWRI